MDPYAALRYKEFKIFLLARFTMVFAWSMQFIVIEWLVYTLTKDPLSLGIIGLMEVIPAVSTALFAGHFVDQKEKRNLLLKCILGFTAIGFGLFLLPGPYHFFVDRLDRSEEAVSECSHLEQYYLANGGCFRAGFCRLFNRTFWRAMVNGLDYGIFDVCLAYSLSYFPETYYEYKDRGTYFSKSKRRIAFRL